LIVDTNYGAHGLQSTAAYNHFSVLKSIESGFGLPCLNHACDSNVNLMTDLFGAAPLPASGLPSAVLQSEAQHRRAAH